MSESLRSIPAVHRFLSDAGIAAYEPIVGRENLKRTIATVLDAARANGADSPSFAALHIQVLENLEKLAAGGLTGVINGTGVLLHTNLGRAPIAEPALRAALDLGAGYTNLEFDVIEGARGSRYSRLSALLCEVTGAQDGIVVNNCAAAVLLMLDTFAKDREVVVARNQLIEIGGGFRLPDVFARSGAQLVEVGATNKVYLSDFERALSANSALLFRSHLSNFRMVGFTHDVEAAELVALGKRAGIPVVEDLGSGALVDLAAYGLPHERTVQEAVSDGLDLVAFSGDKLLGGPQAGIIVGHSAHIARLRSNPLIRALRVDKITLAMLSETLRLYLSPQSVAEIPLYAMLSANVPGLRERAARYCQAVPALTAVECRSTMGGGSLPGSEIPSYGVSLEDRGGDRAAQLRRAAPPILGRTEGGRFILDLRTISPRDDERVIGALATRA